MKFSGIQQMGIGVPDVHEAWDWYRTYFSMDVPVFEEAATAALMLPYTGGQPHDRHAILALNMQGGGGFEIWQYTSRTPQPASRDIVLGDLGLFACKLKTADITQSFQHFPEKYRISHSIQTAPNGDRHFFVTDLYGNIFQLVEESNQFSKSKGSNGGVYGALIGVSDLNRSIAFYNQVLDYELVSYSGEGNYSDFEGLPNGGHHFKRAILKHSKARIGGFSKMLGPSQIELVQDLDQAGSKIFEGRYWGDLGYIHLCFDTIDMAGLQQQCTEAGHPFTVDSANSFDMGEAAGRFSYIEDPDGTLIEFVETHKIPIVKKWGWYLNLNKRDKRKALPNWMLRSLSFNRKK